MKLIPLTQNQFAKVDDKWFDYLMQWKWQADYYKCTNSYYAIRMGRKSEGDLYGKRIRMHRIVSGAKADESVDHIYHDTLDNREFHIRVCTRSQNNMNQRVREDNTSNYKGVNFHNQTNKWRARIQIEGRRKSLGTFTCKHEAARAYNLAARMYHGEFAYTNIIKDYTNG